MRTALPAIFRVLAYDSIGSTSDEALRLAQDGAAHGTVVVAREQTAGRGRAGRAWASPAGNLYLSVLLRVDVAPARIAELSFVAALAVADAVDTVFPGRARLKWPNDVLVDGAKIAGVLIERTDDVAIIGIGLNVASHPRETAYPVTCLHAMTASAGAAEVTIDAVLNAALGALAARLNSWRAHGFSPIRADWLARAHPPGTPLRAGGTDGTFATIEADGALLLDTPDGPARIVAGEVQLR